MAQEKPVSQFKQSPNNSHSSSKLNSPASPSFPTTRMRRNRTDGWVRDMVAENHLSTSDLIWPVFVIEGTNKTEQIKTMPGVERVTIDILVKRAAEARDMGIPAIAIFPALDGSCKTEYGEESYNPDNLVNRAIRAIKQDVPDIGVVADVALDPYTSHGHDGLIKDDKILNDESIEVLCKQALMQARAGVDVIAPSDMMDGRILHIRNILDQEGHEDVKIMSYAAKYASSFYGPFRDAVNSGNFLKGDKKTYQMNPANTDEALREVKLDINEGADMVMIKPGLPYLDVIYRVKQEFRMPTFAYNVSGEYAMIRQAADAGCLDYNKAIIEMLTSFKRAGADGILTYTSLDAAKIILD
ncbi:MAG: porphobilinogen synthase [Alphaproteobacteria bacterium]|jgi:porphobilinogen synthase|nr:porphobilinogen synthase [Alphaproteobacteria bacterium]MDP7222813.1 porphobilinogen synthase [Alphaproteobacteria bacterium]